MNILTSKLPNTIKYKSREYPIKTDFRIWLKFDEIMRSSKKTEETVVDIIRLCMIPGELPPMEAILSGLFEFYRAGCDTKEKSTKEMPIFSYEHDSEYIYAAFLQVYGIDLIDITDLHWFKFQALLSALPEDTKLSKILSYRAADTKVIKDSNLKKSYEKLKRLYALPDERTKEEKERAFAEELSRL